MTDAEQYNSSLFQRLSANIAPVFGGHLSSVLRERIGTIVRGWEDRYPQGDLRWLAYIFGTVKWETASTMQPIEEYGKGRGRPYGEADEETGQTYYGRGYVQLTWKANYQKMGERLGVDLVNHPEKALEPDIAAKIMFDGMVNGLFTGVGLPRYFNDDVEDWVNARRIINGTDHANEIAAIARSFYAAMKE